MIRLQNYQLIQNSYKKPILSTLHSDSAIQEETNTHGESGDDGHNWMKNREVSSQLKMKDQPSVMSKKLASQLTKEMRKSQTAL